MLVLINFNNLKLNLVFVFNLINLHVMVTSPKWYKLNGISLMLKKFHKYFFVFIVGDVPSFSSPTWLTFLP